MAFDISTLKKRRTPRFMTLLSSVACEWLLIFLLYVDAVFSYAITRFAHYCELKAPCPICSRLDNILGEKRYWSLLCSNHRDEISSLVSCSIHNKLADVHDMCEECLLPIAMQKNNSNSKSYMMLVGKMWVDVEESVYQNLVVNKCIRLGFSGRRTCLCCNRIWRNKSNAEKLLLEFTPVGLGASKAHMKPPLPRVTGRSRFNRRDSLKRLRDKLTTQPTSRVHTLCHVGYTKLKIASDSESEVPFSEDDDEDEEESGSRVKYQPSSAKPLLILDQTSMLDLSDHKNELSSKLDCVKEHGLEEFNWMDCYHEPNPSLTTELISFDDDDGLQTSAVSLPYITTISVLSELLSLHTSPPLSDTMAIPETVTNFEAGSEKSVMEAEHVDADSTSEQTNTDLIDCSTQSCKNTKLSVFMEAELLNVPGSPKIEEILNIPCHIAVCVLPKDTEGTPNIEPDNESRKDEGSNSPNLARSASYESLDGDRIKDIEGESIVDRLKRQIDHDRTCMDSLYKELEEERNASSVAANEAMAMITRLQEEKAALHMEALQYLRMMEEQAEYDMEALERANDLLAEKEKELQDLETELELYRNNFIDESEENKIPAPGSFNHVKSTEISKTNGNSTPIKSSPVSKFEDEKFYIRQCLKNLEEKLHESYFSCKIGEKPNGLNAEDGVNGFLKERVISDSNGFHTVSNGSYVAVKESDCVFNKPSANGSYVAVEEISSAIEKEITQLHYRLEALENDQDFLNHASYLFRNGEDGLNFIQEISHQLHELRKMEFRNR